MSRKSKALEFADDVYDITVTGRNVQVTDPMKNYAIDKISKIDRFHHRILNVNVVMDIQKLDHRVDIILKFDNQKIKVSARSEDMYASIDKAVDRLKNQIRRYKEKFQNHHSISHEDIAMSVNIYTPSDNLLDINEDIEAENERQLMENYRPHQLVKTETRPLSLLKISEAIVRLELSNDAFLVFKCEEENEEIRVIYRRTDGNFGIIVPH